MGNWVASHIAGRSAYQFLNDYQETNGSSSLAHTGSFTYEITHKANENQVTFPLVFKGSAITNNPSVRTNNVFFLSFVSGYLYIRIYGTSFSDAVIYARTLNPVVSSDVQYIAFGVDFTLKKPFLYINGISTALELIYVNGYSLSTWSLIGGSNFPAVQNDSTSKIFFGKALGFEQYEGIIYDQKYHEKVLSPVEISNRWTVVQNPSPPTLQNIVYASDVITTPRFRLWTMNEKGGDKQILYDNATYSFYNCRFNKSSNSSLDATKIIFQTTGTGGIWVANRDMSLLTNNFEVGETILNPSFNYTLTKVIYSKLVSGRYQLFIADFNANTNVLSNATQLINNTSFDYLKPVYSPNNLNILYQKIRVSDNFEFLCENTADGLNETEIFGFDNNSNITGLGYNRSQTKIGFSRKVNMGTSLGYLSQLFIMDSNYSNLKQLTGDGYRNDFKDFSNDGSKILMESVPLNYNLIGSIDIDGFNRKFLSTHVTGFSEISANWYE